MKNKQFGVLNNGGGHKQKCLCKIHKRMIAVLSSMTMLFTTSAVLPNNTFNLVGEITANAEAEEQTFIVNGMDFKVDASEGNWKEGAKLENDGYQWDSNNKILTLGNIYFNNRLRLPPDSTIIIADGTHPTFCKTDGTRLGDIRSESSLTITGNGTLTVSEIYYNGNLTITENAEVVVGVISINSGHIHNIFINSNGRLNVSGKINISEITIEDNAVIEMKATSYMTSHEETIEKLLSDLENYIPSGYKIEKDYYNYFIIPKSASVVYVDNEGEILYPDGTPVTGTVTLKANQQTDTGEKLVGHSISLKGNIGVNFYMELDESIVADENAYMQFTLPDGHIQAVNVSQAKTSKVDEKTYYVFSCDVVAKEMQDKITAQMITSDGEGTVYEYSVKEYADYITSHSRDYYDDTINLVEAMMNYGNSAKAYFRKEDTTDISDMTANNLVAFGKKLGGELPDGIIYYGSSLLLESNTTVRHYFKAEKGMSVIEYGFSGYKDGYYYTDITGISAANLGTPQTTTIGDWSISYSPMSYAYDVLNSDTASDNLKNLVKALYLYNQAAEAYQNNGGK